jgi:hypothetical protein
MASKLECSTSDESLQLLLPTGLSGIIKGVPVTEWDARLFGAINARVLPHSCLKLKSL